MWQYNDATFLANHNDSNSLIHYGITGMKWGVRRYQNYDGSYTQRGLSRYRKSEAKYDEAEKKYRDTKVSGDRVATKKARQELRDAKRNVKRDYKQLKSDRMADEGKKLYGKGLTISENNRRQKLVETVALGASFASEYLSRQYNVPVAGYLASAAAGYTILGAEMVRRSRNKKLRAYYGHSRGVAPV